MERGGGGGKGKEEGGGNAKLVVALCHGNWDRVPCNICYHISGYRLFPSYVVRFIEDLPIPA